MIPKSNSSSTPQETAPSSASQTKSTTLDKLASHIPRNEQGKVTELDFRRSKITDAGLVHLKGLTKLKWLYLDGTKVTDAGVAEVRHRQVAPAAPPVAGAGPAPALMEVPLKATTKRLRLAATTRKVTFCETRPQLILKQAARRNLTMPNTDIPASEYGGAISGNHCLFSALPVDGWRTFLEPR